MSNDGVFDDVEEAQRRRLAAIEDQPVVNVTGIVDSSGVAASDTDTGGIWHAFFAFTAWRADGASVVRKDLVVHDRAVPEAELEPLQLALPEDTIVRVRMKLDTETPSSQGLLVEVVDSDAEDDELAAVLQDELADVQHHDSQFGAFTWDRRISHYAAMTRWRGKQVKLSLSVGGRDNIHPALACARALWSKDEVWEHAARALMREEFLRLKNETWLGEGERPVTAAEFDSRATLASITVSGEGYVEFSFDDGDLFWGHRIVVSGTVDDGPDYADLFG